MRDCQKIYWKVIQKGEKDMKKTIDKNQTHEISRSLVDIKKNNPDFQIPMIYDGSFKTVCKTFPEFITPLLLTHLVLSQMTLKMHILLIPRFY